VHFCSEENPIMHVQSVAAAFSSSNRKTNMCLSFSSDSMAEQSKRRTPHGRGVAAVGTGIGTGIGKERW
jgi:predicted glutamine amidotransferase